MTVTHATHDDRSGLDRFLALPKPDESNDSDSHDKTANVEKTEELGAPDRTKWDSVPEIHRLQMGHLSFRLNRALGEAFLALKGRHLLKTSGVAVGDETVTLNLTFRITLPRSIWDEAAKHAELRTLYDMKYKNRGAIITRAALRAITTLIIRDRERGAEFKRSKGTSE
jgi:hypothetical protein